VSTAQGRSSTTRFALKLAAAVIAVIVAVYFLLLSDLQRTRKWRLDRLHALGVPTTWADAAPPPVPDKDNAAILYQKAFGLLSVSDADRDVIRRFVRDKPPGARKRLRTQVQAILTRNRASLAVLPRAAAMPRCRFPLNWDAAPPDILVPHLGKLRFCATMLVADALVAAQEGETDRATASYRTCLRMCAHAAQEPMTISFLMAAAVEKDALNALPDVVDRVPFAADRRALYDDLARLDFDTGFQRGQITNAAWTLWYFGAAEKQPEKVRELFRGFAVLDDPPGSASSDLVPRPLVNLYLSPLAKALRLKEEIAYAQALEEILPLSAKRYRMAKTRCERVEAKMRSASTYYLIIQFVAPLNMYSATTRDRAIAMRDAMEIALALKAYHLKHGRYPQSLDALRDYPSWKLNEDPFSGKPFVYHRKGAGFVLYSWGPDLKDDGGQALDPKSRQGDLVWQFRR